MKHQEHVHARLVADIFHNRGFYTTIIRNVVFVYLPNRRINTWEVTPVIEDEFLPIDDSQVIRNRYGEVEIRLENDDDLYIIPETNLPIDNKYLGAK